MSSAAGGCIVIADLYHAYHVRFDFFQVEPRSSIGIIKYRLDGYVLGDHIRRISLYRLGRFEVDFLVEIDSAAFKPDVNADRFKAESLFGDAGDNMLGGMPACNGQSVPPVHAGDVLSIT